MIHMVIGLYAEHYGTYAASIPFLEFECNVQLKSQRANAKSQLSQ